MSSVRTYTSVVSSSATTTIPIEDLVSRYAGRVNYRPVYQRDIRWDNVRMNKLIMTIMKNAFVPELLFYTLHDDERGDSSIEWECIDGQHRFFVLEHFLKGMWVELPRQKPFMISLEYIDVDGKKTYVFFAENDATKKWRRDNPNLAIDYFSASEQRSFRNFEIRLHRINNQLSLDTRRQIFLNMQNGVPVRGSDYHKNQVDIPLIALIAEKGWESTHKMVMLNHLTKNMGSFWIHWFIRMFLLSRSGGNMVDFKMNDTTIGAMMKNKDVKLDTTVEEETAFVAQIDCFFNFMASLPDSAMFSPCHMYALFIHSLKNRDLDAIRPCLASWLKTHPECKTLWAQKDATDMRMEATMDLLNTLGSHHDSIPSSESDSAPRWKISKKMRNFLWKREFNTSTVGKCHCCNSELNLLTGGWEAGHILAHTNGGADTADNLMPICRTCNGEMGAMHMDEFKARLVAEAIM